MSIDLSQFHQVFFEESFEGLDIMESGLLDLSLDEVDDETINAIFRAAHSIKGGAGTFGFQQVSEFTHVLETLLDEIRSGMRAMEQQHVDLFLQSVDCLKGLLSDLQAGNEPDMTQADELKVQFEAILAGESADNSANAAEAMNEEAVIDEQKGAAGPEGWRIDFIPNEDILCTGNEPYRMFRELKDLADGADFEVVPDVSRLPEFSAMHPELCYVSWTIFLRKNVELSDIEEVFEWVVDDCEIRYQKLDHLDTEELLAAQQQQAQPEVASSVETSASKPAEAEAVQQKEPTPVSADAGSTDEAAAQPVSDGGPQTTAPVVKKQAVKKPATKAAENTSIRVSIDKIDSLINMVGELVITQSMLGQLGQEFDISRVQRLQEGLSQLEQNTRELQESVMKIRMLPISFAFSRFPRLVRDLGKQLGKQVDLVMLGENTELDKTVMEKIGDPLVHLVRNSLDHGLESPQQRLDTGKGANGTITLNAFHQGGNIVIEVKDDGAGLNGERIRDKAIENGLISADEVLSDEQIYDLIFQPGFSTAEVVSDVSGRGVGMDVVRRNIAELNGSIEVTSKPGEGSVFTIRLPLTLAILDGQLVRVGEEVYIFPLVSIVESIQLEQQMLNNITGSQHVMQLRNDYIPIVSLHKVFNIEPEHRELDGSMLVVVEGDNEKIGIVVDELLGQQQVVIKSLEQNYQKVESISGATILGDGTVALIVDISGLSKSTEQKVVSGQNQAA